MEVSKPRSEIQDRDHLKQSPREATQQEDAVEMERSINQPIDQLAALELKKVAMLAVLQSGLTPLHTEEAFQTRL